ncbi:hypothetical protein CYCD_06990 [Tenuifilaceae bacterium CYCD]|nr:hypothetical protein CYCD_06990 [Tenuifilaceae bacterium CYCD]
MFLEENSIILIIVLNEGKDGKSEEAKLVLDDPNALSGKPLYLYTCLKSGQIIPE